MANLLLQFTPENKVHIWENIYSKAFADLRDVYYWDFNSNEWTKVDAFVWDGVVWKQISYIRLDIYNEGIEGVPLVAGFSSYGNLPPTFEKRQNDILLKSVDTKSSAYEVSLTLDSAIDLRPFKTAWCEVSLIEVVGAFTEGVYFLVGPTKMGSKASSVVFKNDRVVGNNKIFELDVTSLEGDYYIRVHSAGGTVNVHKIWLT